MLSTTLVAELKAQYGEKKVDDAIKLLTYYHPDPLPKTESDTKPTIYIFRHGESEDNKAFIFSGWRDPAITQTGTKQAKILAHKLKGKKIDMLISSEQKRAIETMKVAMSENKSARNLEIILDKRIKERSYGDLQGQNKLETYLKDPEGTQKIRRNFKTVPPNGESIEMVSERVAKFCDEIIPLMKKNNVNVAVSCHGNSIRGFRRYFENLSDEKTAKIETPLGQDYAAYVV